MFPKITLQGYKLLLQLRKLQQQEDRWLFIPSDRTEAHRMVGGNSEECLDLSQYAGRLTSTARHLAGAGLLTIGDPSLSFIGFCRVTHDGFHVIQWDARRALDFLFRSILVPVIVAAITAIIVA